MSDDKKDPFHVEQKFDHWTNENIESVSTLELVTQIAKEQLKIKQLTEQLSQKAHELKSLKKDRDAFFIAIGHDVFKRAMEFKQNEPHDLDGKLY